MLILILMLLLLKNQNENETLNSLTRFSNDNNNKLITINSNNRISQ